MKVEIQANIVAIMTREEASILNQSLADLAIPDGSIIDVLTAGISQALDDSH